MPPVKVDTTTTARNRSGFGPHSRSNVFCFFVFDDILVFFIFFCLWYYNPFYPLWNLILALTRFTALFFFKQHKSLWERRNLKIIFFVLLIYPLILNGYSLSQAYCFLPEYQLNFEKLTKYCSVFIKWFDVSNISGTVHVFAAFILGLATVFVRQLKKQSLQLELQIFNRKELNSAFQSNQRTSVLDALPSKLLRVLILTSRIIQKKLSRSFLL